MLKKGLFIVAVLSCGSDIYALTPNDTDVYQLPETSIQQLLGWITDPLSGTLCKGYYTEKLIQYPHEKDSSLVDFSGSDSYLYKSGISKMVGNVVLKQYNREVTADVGYVYRDTEGNPTQITLEGDVNLKQPTQLIVAKSGTLLLPGKQWEITNALFRQTLSSRHTETSPKSNEENKTERHIYQLSAWGKAETIEQTSSQLTDIYNTTYTTCSPTCHTWHLRAQHVHLDQNTGRGTIKHSVLYVHHVPVFYLPYFNFPIDDRRQSGLLNPSYGHSTANGTQIAIPFYWNLAPNYDTTITPIYMSERGWQFNNALRYLTTHSSGTLNTSLMPNDQKFQSVKRDLSTAYAGVPERENQVNDLLHSTDKRYSLDWENSTYINPFWNAEINYNRVSDDYYLQDFGQSLAELSQDQLLQQGTLNYYNEHSTFVMNLQQYQTLHPLNEADVNNQYARLPQLDYSYSNFSNSLGLQWNAGTEWVNFNKNKNPFNIASRSPTVGDRFNLQPSLSLPIQNEYAFITPRIQYLLTDYQLQRPGIGMNGNPTRTIPIFDLHSGLYFDRKAKLFGYEYTQSIEPELYYLYVPYRNQNGLPLFDTTDNTNPTTFNYDNLFDYNRFSGIDRIGDANQITAALSTHYRDSQSGNEKFSAAIGQIYYFKDRRTLACLNDNSNNPDQIQCTGTLPSYNQEKYSPVAGLFNYALAKYWSLTGNIAYDAHQKEIDNQTIGFQYKQDYQHILNINYTFARNGDPYQGTDIVGAESNLNNLKQTTISTAWPITEQWSGLAQWNYNLSHKHLQAYLYGIEYNACCFALRVIIDRVFTGLNTNFQNQYDTRFYLQFALKGFSRLGTSDPGTIIAGSIAGYNDYFGEDY